MNGTYANIDKPNLLEGAAAPPDPRLLPGLQVINSCSGNDVPWTVTRLSITPKYIRTRSQLIRPKCMQMIWVQIRCQDDRESLDPAEMKKSSIYRFFRKLERDYVACHVVTSELVYLVRSGDVEHNVTINVTVETLPIWTTTSTPAEQNEYPTCEDFFRERFQTVVNTLNHKKFDKLWSSWPRVWKSNNLFLHAEIQMALFYALNPQLHCI